METCTEHRMFQIKLKLRPETGNSFQWGEKLEDELAKRNPVRCNSQLLLHNSNTHSLTDSVQCPSSTTKTPTQSCKALVNRTPLMRNRYVLFSALLHTLSHSLSNDYSVDNDNPLSANANYISSTQQQTYNK